MARELNYPTRLDNPNVSFPSGGAFTGANHFILENPTFIEELRAEANDPSRVLRYIVNRIKKFHPGAMLDSAEREYPPRCNPDTRRRLRNRIVEWGTIERPTRDWRMLWLSGPAGVGKAAVAQTVGEEFRERGRLAAAFFFSRANHHDDPSALIPTIAYQLALKDPRYKHIITQRFADDPLIFEKNRRTQFKELIIDPFQILATKDETIVRNPSLIVIDGLDECHDEKAQREFIELIGSHARLVAKFPLIWMICSRPELHIKSAFANPDWQITCKRETLDINDAEARSDAWRILRSGFEEIRKQYPDQLGPEWPRFTDMECIATTGSGHLGFVSFILRFIEDKHYGDPVGQLRTCIQFLKRPQGSHGSVNPFHALDLLYQQILSDVPERDLPTTMRIIGMLILYPTQQSLHAQNQANFLDLDRSTFYRSLQRLHSVLYIPLAPKAFLESIHIYHTSFSDFLLTRVRSGRFCLDKRKVHLDVALKALCWQSHAIRAARGALRAYPKFKWVQNQSDGDVIFYSLNTYSAGVGWSACCSIDEDSVPTLIAQLERFDFSGLRKSPENFGNFLRWLYCLGPRCNSLIQIMEREEPPSAGQNSVASNLVVEHRVSDMTTFLTPFNLDINDTNNPATTTLKFLLGTNTVPLKVTLILHQTTPFTPYTPARSMSTPSSSHLPLEEASPFPRVPHPPLPRALSSRRSDPGSATTSPAMYFTGGKVTAGLSEATNNGQEMPDDVIGPSLFASRSPQPSEELEPLSLGTVGVLTPTLTLSPFDFDAS